METLLLQLFSFFRPILFIKLDVGVFGLGLFDIAGIVFIALISASVLAAMVSNRSFYVSSVDVLMFLYVLWCVGTFIAFPEKSDVKAVVKWTTPFITYVAAKNALRTAGNYLSAVKLMLLGTALPLLYSAVLIATGNGISKVLERDRLVVYYSGVYDNSHTLGHSMGLFLMLGCVYWIVARARGIEVHRWQKAAFLALLPVSLFNLYFAQVRTEFVGLLIFFTLLSFHYNRKLFGIGAVVFIAGGIVLAPKLAVMFSDVVNVFSGDRPVEKMASGRIGVWTENMSVFSRLSLEKKLAGAGIGNRAEDHRADWVGGAEFVPSHNDYLTVLTDTGVVGLLLFLAMQLAIFIKILSMEGEERFLFLSFFVAVSAMNFASNSFFTRYGLAQMFYMVIAYVEMSQVRAGLVGARDLGSDTRSAWRATG